VTNDLLDTAASVERILCPSQNAFDSYDMIVKECMKQPKDKLFLISLGAAAKPLVTDLFHAGYRAIDIGNLDTEYEWFLEKADGKGRRHPKHELIGHEANEKAGYTGYLSEIIAEIGEKQVTADMQKEIQINS
jgi:hypothetical protein